MLDFRNLVQLFIKESWINEKYKCKLLEAWKETSTNFAFFIEKARNKNKYKSFRPVVLAWTFYTIKGIVQMAESISEYSKIMRQQIGRSQRNNGRIISHVRLYQIGYAGAKFSSFWSPRVACPRFSASCKVLALVLAKLLTRLYSSTNQMFAHLWFCETLLKVEPKDKKWKIARRESCIGARADSKQFQKNKARHVSHIVNQHVDGKEKERFFSREHQITRFPGRTNNSSSVYKNSFVERDCS